MKKVNQKTFEKEYLITDNSDLAKKYDCSEGIIRVLAAAFHLKKGQCRWSKKDDEYLLKNYHEKPIGQLMTHLNRSNPSIRNRYSILTKSK